MSFDSRIPCSLSLFNYELDCESFIMIVDVTSRVISSTTKYWITLGKSIFFSYTVLHVLQLINDLSVSHLSTAETETFSYLIITQYVLLTLSLFSQSEAKKNGKELMAILTACHLTNTRSVG